MVTEHDDPSSTYRPSVLEHPLAIRMELSLPVNTMRPRIEACDSGAILTMFRSPESTISSTVPPKAVRSTHAAGCYRRVLIRSIDLRTYCWRFEPGGTSFWRSSGWAMIHRTAESKT